MWLVWFLSHLNCFTNLRFVGGDDGIRTHDPLLAGQVLSQLSYTPINLMVVVVFSVFRLGRVDCSTLLAYVSIGLSSRTASREVLSPLQSLTSVFGMGTGGPSAFMTLTLFSPLSRFSRLVP